MIQLSQRRITFSSYFSNIILDSPIYSTSIWRINFSTFLKTLEENENYMCWIELDWDEDGEEIDFGSIMMGKILINKFSSPEIIENYFNRIHNGNCEIVTFNYVKIKSFDINPN